MRGLVALCATLCFGTAAHAEPAVGDCQGWQANAANVDWSQPSPTFAEGAVRLVALDTEEPAAAAFHVMVLMPGDAEFGQLCYLVSNDLEGSGFAALDLARAVTSYSPATGLSVTMPVGVIAANGDVENIPMLLIIDQSAPSVTALLLD